MDWHISVKDLNSNELLHELLERQRLSLHRFGLKDAIVKQEDLEIIPGMYAVTASLSTTGEMIGGMRIYTRSENHCLPLESEESFLPEEYRDIIRVEPNICELRGLWVAAEYSGRTLAKEIMARAVLECYTQGFSGVVGTTQIRTFKHLGEPLGFTREMSIPPFPFPDARFETIVAWHQKNAVTALEDDLYREDTAEAN
ncbi:hypothetical protein ACUHMQ_00570 [Chitinimonas sp. PSY-7]|uniref:hypothetical protein n=1 Tax=Chitinimonas sp. PSY-7 TaxID=3459088 RepID=UPI004040291F